jgi:hypothetical protein
MNIREIADRLSTAPIDSSRLGWNGNTMLTNIDQFKFLVERLGDLPGLASLGERVRSSPLWDIGASNFAFPSEQAAVIKQMADEFWLTAQGLNSSLPTFVEPVPPESIVVKLSDARDDLVGIVHILERLQKALGQLVTEEGIEGELKVPHWEKGSLLLFLWLKSLAAIDLVGRTLKSAAVAYTEVQRGRLIGQYVRGLKIKNEMNEVLKKAHEEKVKELIEREAVAIDTEMFPKRDNERTRRIENSIHLLTDLLVEGTKIYPALEMPADKKEQFPDLDKLTFPETKQLEDAEIVGESKPKSEDGDTPKESK